MDRIRSLDVLRGIAILGTLATNIWIFTNPEGLVGYISRSDPLDGGWQWVEKVMQQLAQGKFLGLLTIMFGIGLAIQQQSALRRGRPWPGPYPWRALLLFIDGIVHFVLVVEFDVLTGYAVTGLVVAFVLATSERAQRRWMWTAAAIHLALLTLITLALAFAAEPETAPAPLDPNPYADGSWLDLVVFRLDNVVLFRFEPVFVFAMSIALFLAGARLYRAGVLGPQGHRIRVRLMLAGAIAWPIDMALGVAGGYTGVIAARYGTAAIVAFGLLGLIAEFYVRRTVGVVGRRLSEVGRMALSSYVLQNIVASIICYGWGFGLADRVSGTARIPFTLAVYVVVAAVVTVFAHVWLMRYDKGPVEWLWHASYLRIVSKTAANGATMATMTSKPADEVVAVYDSERNVIGEAPRSVVYADGLWHATSGVLVRSCDGERIYVHRRTDTKSIFPGMHDCLAGGVVDPGETIESAAIRELEEELGIATTSLRPLTDLSWDGTWHGKPMRCHMFAFEIASDGPFRHQASEIVDGWWWTDAELREHLADPTWPFVPDTRLLVPGMLRSLA